MNIIEAIDESKRLCEMYLNSANLSEMRSDADVLIKKIREKEMDYYLLFNDVKAMKEAGLIDASVLSDMLEVLESIKFNVEKDDYSYDKINLVSKECARIAEDVDIKWSRYVKREVGTQKDIVETLRVLIEDSQRYLTLNSIYSDIISSKTPGSKDVITKMATYKTLSSKMIEELDLKDSIFAFFRKLASKNVISLKELKPEILAWIQENDFEDKFTIKISDE